jgi:rod shape-determining protein MreD
MIQETPGLIPEILGAKPIILIPAALSIALFENETAGMIFGLYGGLLIDFGAGGIMGFHGLILSVMCYIIGRMASDLIQTNFLTSMMVSLICSGITVFLQFVFFYILYNYSHVFYALWAHYLPRFLYTAAIMPVTYYFNRALFTQINDKE